MTSQLMLEFDDLVENKSQDNKEILKFQSSMPLLGNWVKYITFNTIDQPIVDAYTGVVPYDIMAMYRFTRKKTIPDSVCPHHFTDDSHIEPLWNNPARTIKRLLNIGWTISPDFSLYTDMLRPQKRWNSFRNKFLSALWQAFGIKVIPAPSWSDLDDMDYYLSGWPI